MKNKPASGPLMQQVEALTQQDNNSPAVCYLQALMHRAEQQRPPVAELLRQKAQDYLQDFAATKEQGPADTRTVKNHGLEALKKLNREINTGKQTTPAEPSSGLAMDDFLQHQEQTVLQQAGIKHNESTDDSTAGFTELRAERLFRERQLQRFADELVQQAIHHAPENPGPLNPQMLAIRSLTAMRELSPHYLSRFVSQIDTLFWLEHTGRD